MAKEREVFINGQVDEDGNVVVPGCVRNGIDAQSANKIFDEMSEFAKYAFNKSHAACYAVVAYRTAYLKAYYPAEFMASMLNSYLGNLDKVPEYIDECKKLGIEILKPDINKSSGRFTVEDGKIRFGLGSIKNVGVQPVENIIKERSTNGEFTGFTDFCERMAGESVNKKCVESLIKAGTFTEFPETRATLLASFETIIDTIQSYNKKGIDGQVSMFDLGGESNEKENNINEIKYNFMERPELNERELLSIEKEMLGIYISGHPLEKIREQIIATTNISSLQMHEIDEINTASAVDDGNMDIRAKDRMKFEDGQQVKIAGIITSVKKKYTKNNKIMAFVTIEDLYGSAEIIVFEPTYMKAQNVLVEENIVMINGRLSIREDDATKIVANEIKNFGENKPNMLTLNITNLTEEQKAKLRGAIKFFHGEQNNISVIVKVNDDLKPCGAIYFTDEILKVFEEIVGKENIAFS